MKEDETEISIDTFVTKLCDINGNPIVLYQTEDYASSKYILFDNGATLDMYEELCEKGVATEKMRRNACRCLDSYGHICAKINAYQLYIKVPLKVDNGQLMRLLYPIIKIYEAME